MVKMKVVDFYSILVVLVRENSVKLVLKLHAITIIMVLPNAEKLSSLILVVAIGKPTEIQDVLMKNTTRTLQLTQNTMVLDLGITLSVSLVVFISKLILYLF